MSGEILTELALYVDLPPGWELEVRRDLIHVVHPDHGSLAIPEDYSYTYEYRDTLKEGFEQRCEPPPNFCIWKNLIYP